MTSSDDDGDSRAKMSDEKAAEDECSDLLCLPREILEKIINYLNPKALRELALTCQGLFHFCLHSKGIHVVFPVEEVIVFKKRNGNGNITGPINYEHNCHLKKGDFEKYLETLHKWHFAIHVGELVIWRGVRDELLNAKDFFMRNGVQKIQSLRFIPETVEEAVAIRGVVKAFGVENLILDTSFYRHTPAVAVEACLKLPVNELRMPPFHGHINVDALHDCSISSVVAKWRITAADLKEIVKIWRSKKGLERWAFSLNTANAAQFANIFNSYGVLPFDYSGPIDKSRPLAFKKVDGGFWRTTFYFPREDGLVFCVGLEIGRFGNIAGFPIMFQMCPIDEYPLALREH